MKRAALLTVSAFLLSGIAIAQQSQQPTTSTGQSPDDILNAPMTPPRSDAPKKTETSSDKKNSPNTNSDSTKSPDYSTNPPTDFPFPENEEPRSYSSSKDSVGDITPPTNDANRPGNNTSLDPNTNVNEMKPWNPYKADNDIEVGTFYMKRGNYKAAEARFRDALYWQDNNAVATYRLATLLDKEKRGEEARPYFESYLRILPHGEYSGECKKALGRLNANGGKKPQSKKTATSPPS
ncbi:MAG TPA: hypothetical protein VMU28_02795 [Terriglobales bacterium]|nr:hypothetical protein [Terriglobales bacterium]